ncbi:hypothetical protein, partial [Frankia sp. CpI1-P]
MVPDRPQIYRQIHSDLRQEIEDGLYPP